MFHNLIARRRNLLNDSILRRVLVNSSWLIGSNTISAALTLALAVVMTHALGVEQYGVLVLITNYTLTIDQLIDSRVWEAVTKFIPQYRETGDIGRATAVLKLFYLLETAAAMVTVVVIMLTATFAATTFTKDPAIAVLLRFYSLQVLINFSTEISSALLRIHNRFKWLSYQDVFQAVLKIGGALLVWGLGGGLEWMIAALLVTSLAGVVVLQVMAYRAVAGMGLTQWRAAPLRLLRGEFRTIFSFLLFTNLNASSRLLDQRIDLLVLGWLSTPAATALYDVGRRLVYQFQTLFGPFNTAAYPEISRLIARGEYLQVTSVQKKLTKSIAIVVIPLCLGLTILFPLVIPLLFGEDYAAAVPLAQVMVWGLPFWVTLIWMPGFLLSLGRVRLVTMLTWATTVFYLVALVIGISSLGSMGAALAVTMRYVVWFTLAIIILQYLKRIGWRRAHQLSVIKQKPYTASS